MIYRCNCGFPFVPPRACNPWLDSGDICDDYLGNPAWCTLYGGRFDDDDFTAVNDCCACGGGVVSYIGDGTEPFGITEHDDTFFDNDADDCGICEARVSPGTRRRDGVTVCRLCPGPVVRGVGL